MSNIEVNNTSLAFEKARNGLWQSLQKHLADVYAVDRSFQKCLTFATSYPFNASEVETEKLEEYQQQRGKLRNLFIDETMQLDGLVRAVRTKQYDAADKKQLFVLILGYLSILESVAAGLDVYRPQVLPKDEELTEAQERFSRIKNFAQLNVKGIGGLLPQQ